MKRWHNYKSENVTSEKIDNFLEEVIAICKKYDLSISHEDNHGEFLIKEFSEDNAEWLRNASIAMKDVP